MRNTELFDPFILNPLTSELSCVIIWSSLLLKRVNIQEISLRLRASHCYQSVNKTDFHFLPLNSTF